MSDIRIATVATCDACGGTGHYQSRGWDPCKSCSGSGKIIGRSITIKELKELLGIPPDKT